MQYLFHQPSRNIFYERSNDHSADKKKDQIFF